VCDKEQRYLEREVGEGFVDKAPLDHLDFKNL
jgi:hypothetical protein